MYRVNVALMCASLLACADQDTTGMRALMSVADSLEPKYELEIVDTTLGGTTAVGTAINNRGWVGGYSTLANNTRHAVLWRDGVLHDLKTLGGPSSAVQWPGLNGSGTVVGISFTADADPNNAMWSCEAFMGATDRTCRGFYWDEATGMHALETLGGYNGFATGVNSAGQIVGWAETAVEDPTCKRPNQVLQFRAVLWDVRAGTKQQLPPLPGDSTSAATAINERGQAVGISGKCYVAVGDSSARASVLWEHGVPREIPNLGGATWNTPMAINDGGDVAGFSNIGDDATGSPRLFAFLWTGGSIAHNLGALGDDNMSQAYGINARGQVVGRSCGSVCRAFLYDNGVMHDLNELLEPAGHRLELARHINDAGVITGNMRKLGTDSIRIFIARPKGRTAQ